MNTKNIIIIFFVLFTNACSHNQAETQQANIYEVFKLQQPMQIDASWDKPQWQNTEALDIINYTGKIPEFSPSVKAKMRYDSENLYLIFQVKDRYVHCITNEINGPVWEDSCVEFFFSPDTSLPQQYFNLEINCGGTPLMHYNIIPRKETKTLEVKDIEKIEIAHSLPSIVNPELTENVTWIIEYRIPVEILRKYSNVTFPKHGVIWRANFYKIADGGSNPHYITWSVVKNVAEPDFHLPRYFGQIVFQ